MRSGYLIQITNISGFFQWSSQDAISGQLGQKSVSGWYSDQKIRVKGTARCCSNGMAVDFKLDLKKGWNDVVRFIDTKKNENIQTGNNTESNVLVSVAMGDF